MVILHVMKNKGTIAYNITEHNHRYIMNYSVRVTDDYFMLYT